MFVFIESLVKNLKEGCSIVIIHRNLPEDTRLAAHKLVGSSPFDLRFYDIDSYPKISDFGRFLDNPVYWRLVAAEISGQTSGLFLYMDIDVLVREDFSELFEYKLEGRTVGACIDYLSEIKDAVGNWKALRLDPHAPYFNAGLLLIDAKKFNEKSICKKTIGIIAANSEHLVAQGKWPQNDQYGLNVALYGDWLVLPQIYNYGSELDFTECKIVHFIGNGKPLSATCKQEYRNEHQETLKAAELKI